MQSVASGTYKKIQFITNKFFSRFPLLYRLWQRYKIGIKYIFSGGTAAVVDFSLLYILTDWAGLWYMASAVIAYVTSFFTAFFLQKFWTFRDSGMERIKKQFFIYGAIAIVSLIINSLMMYVLVSLAHIWYMAAQFIATGLLAIGSFILNRSITFKNIPRS